MLGVRDSEKGKKVGWPDLNSTTSPCNETHVEARKSFFVLLHWRRRTFPL